MSRFRSIAILCFLLLLFILSCKQKSTFNEAPIVPLKDFFRNPDIAYFQISPDGEKLAFSKPFRKRMNVFVTTIGGKDTVQITFVQDRDISSYFWKSNNRIIYVKDNAGDENFHLYAVDVNGKNLKDLTPFPKVRVQLVNELEENEAEVLIEMNKRNPQLFDVYRLNIHTGEMKLVCENPGGVSQWVADHDGRIRAAVQTDGVNSILLARDSEKEAFRQVLKTNFKQTVMPIMFAFDNQTIYARSNVNRDKCAIVRLDLKSGKELQVLYADSNVDVDMLYYSKKRKVLTYVSYADDKNEKQFLDKETEAIFQKLTAKLGAHYDIFITDHNKDETKLLIRTMNDKSLGYSYYYDVTKDQLTKIADRAPWLKEDEMCDMKPISFKSKDGLTIHGYLTLPKGIASKNLPVVINPHGGPWFRDEWGWNPEVQFLANRGYAVLQLNFRGSTGYGRTFWEAGFKQWGRAMQQDITDGANWLIAEGIADPKRIAIYGASYGGYATLAGVTNQPKLYACGVDYVGVSNLFTFMSTIPPYWKPYMEMIYEMVGNPKTDSMMLRDVSPVFHVDRIKAPLFIAQGANDPRVNKNESDQIVEALKKHGVKVEYMVKENEGHGFRNEENQLDFYGAMEVFLAKHIGGRIDPSAAAQIAK